MIRPDQREILARLVQLEVRVQFARRVIFSRSEHEAIFVRGQRYIRKGPLGGLRRIVRQRPILQAERTRRRIPNLDPVREVSVLIGLQRVVPGEELADDRLGGHQAAVFETLDDLRRGQRPIRPAKFRGRSPHLPCRAISQPAGPAVCCRSQSIFTNHRRPPR